MDEKEFKQFEEKETDRITQKVISIIKESKTLTNKQVNKIIDEELKNDPIYTGLEDWNVWSSKGRIREGVLNNKLLNQGKGELSLSWFDFYVYFRLPAGIVLSFILLFSGGLIAFLNLIDMAIGGTLFWGLKGRKLWAWKMNFIVLMLGTLAYPLEKANNTGEFVVYFFLFALVWLLPNWIYFKKRKYLFLYSFANEGEFKNIQKNMNKQTNWLFLVRQFLMKLVNNFKTKKILWLIISIFVIISLSFYWFQLRPAKIKHDCSWNYSGNHWYEAPRADYDFCIHEKGL